jgi:hypothetical protein
VREAHPWRPYAGTSQPKTSTVIGQAVAKRSWSERVQVCYQRESLHQNASRLVQVAVTFRIGGAPEMDHEDHCVGSVKYFTLRKWTSAQDACAKEPPLETPSRSLRRRCPATSPPERLGSVSMPGRYRVVSPRREGDRASAFVPVMRVNRRGCLLALDSASKLLGSAPLGPSSVGVRNRG